MLCGNHNRGLCLNWPRREKEISITPERVSLKPVGHLAPPTVINALSPEWASPGGRPLDRPKLVGLNMNSQNPLKEKEAYNTDDEIGSEKGHEKEPKRGDGTDGKPEGYKGERGHEADPFKRRSALARTPPTASPSGTPNPRSGPDEKCSAEKAAGEEQRDREKNSNLNKMFKPRDRAHSLPRCKVTFPILGDGRPSKRRRECEDEPPQKLTSDEVNKLIISLKEIREFSNKIRGVVGQLSTLVEGNPNTKVEIKKGISELAWLSARLDKKMDLDITPVTDMLKLSQKETPKMVSSAIQTEPESKSTMALSENTNLVLRKLKTAMRPGAGPEEFRSIMGLNWPLGAFQKVKVERGSIFEIPRDWDLVTMVPRDLNMESGPSRKIRDHYQGVEELRQQGAEVGEMAHLLENLSFPTKDGSWEKRERYICYGIVAETASDTWYIEDVFVAMSRVKEFLCLYKRKKMVVVAPDKINTEHLKKLVEFVFVGTEIEVKVVVETKEKTGDAGKRGDGKPSKTDRRNRGEEAIIISPDEGKTFAETLKKIRNVVDMEATGASVSAIRKTRSGEVLLKIKKQQGVSQADTLKKEISKKMGDVRVRALKEKEVTIHVNGLDGVTEAQELETALRENLENPNAPLKVIALWPAFGGCQNASVNLHKREADTLIRRGRIKVGWVTCRIRERVEVQRCYKCWGHGHLAADCIGVSREHLCRKCGQEGHRAKDCSNDEACWECGARGHRGGTTRCPKYRELLAGVTKRSRRPAPNQL